MYAARLGRASLALALALALAVLGVGSMSAGAAPIAFDMVGSVSQGLTGFTNPSGGAFSSPADGFQKYRRGVSASIPFSLLDDSLSIFPGDSLGIIGEGNTDEFFGVVDTENGDNSGPVSATWSFNIAGSTDLTLSIDMGAMGDFEASDSFQWTYQIDAGPVTTAFASSVNEAGNQTYVLDSGSTFFLDDPMQVDGTALSNNLQTRSTSISGTGTSLSLTLSAATDGGSEAFAFQNIILDGTSAPARDILAFDMVDSASQGLSSFTNPSDGAFGSPSDGFQKYRRGVSASIPFSLLDDSLSIFPGDSLGIIGEGNTDEFFGVVDTENGDNSGPVSATWIFDIAGFEDLELSIEMGAMGDFESGDFFHWTYQIDGGPLLTAFESTVNEDGSQTYTLEDGDSFTLNDPMLMDGVLLSNLLQTFTRSLLGSGDSLLLMLTTRMDGGSEALAFQDIVITGVRATTSAVPEPNVLLLLGVNLVALRLVRRGRA